MTVTGDPASAMTELGQVYRLLARIWLRELDAPTLTALSSPPLRAAYEAAGGIAPPASDPTTQDELAAEYCRLFVGPKQHLPPHQSVWQSGQFEGEATVSMRRWCEILGYGGAVEEGGGLMPDHLGVQLDVLGYLLQQSAARPGDAAELKELMGAFRTAHLRWPKPLFAAVESRQPHPFYRGLVAVTRGSLEIDL